VPIETLLLGEVTGILQGAVQDGLYASFHALVREEINEVDSRKLFSQPFNTAQAHLRNASLETNKDRRQQHIEYARVAFMKSR